MGLWSCFSCSAEPITAAITLQCSSSSNLCRSSGAPPRSELCILTEMQDVMPVVHIESVSALWDESGDGDAASMRSSLDWFVATNGIYEAASGFSGCCATNSVFEPIPMSLTHDSRFCQGDTSHLGVSGVVRCKGTDLINTSTGPLSCEDSSSSRFNSGGGGAVPEPARRAFGGRDDSGGGSGGDGASSSCCSPMLAAAPAAAFRCGSSALRHGSSALPPTPRPILRSVSGNSRSSSSLSGAGGLQPSGSSSSSSGSQSILCREGSGCDRSTHSGIGRRTVVSPAIPAQRPQSQSAYSTATTIKVAAAAFTPSPRSTTIGRPKSPICISHYVGAGSYLAYHFATERLGRKARDKGVWSLVQKSPPQAC